MHKFWIYIQVGEGDTMSDHMSAFIDFNFINLTIPEIYVWVGGVSPLVGLAIHADGSIRYERSGTGVFDYT